MQGYRSASVLRKLFDPAKHHLGRRKVPFAVSPRGNSDCTLRHGTVTVSQERVDHLKPERILALIAVSIFVPAGFAAEALDVPESGEAETQIIERYRTATEAHKDQLRGVQMKVCIQAAIPKLQKT